MSLRDYPNVTLALQFRQKQKVLTLEQKRAYDEKAKRDAAKDAEGTSTVTDNNEEDDTGDNLDVSEDVSFEEKNALVLTLDEQYALYEKNVREIVSYLKLEGMFELKDG